MMYILSIYELGLNELKDTYFYYPYWLIYKTKTSYIFING
jgi:hypothetical protein